MKADSGFQKRTDLEAAQRCRVHPAITASRDRHQRNRLLQGFLGKRLLGGIIVLGLLFQ